MPMALVPEGHQAARELAALQAKTGSEWEVRSDGRRFLVRAGEPAAFNGGCEDIMPLAWSSRVEDPSFATERAKFFLASEPDMHAPGAPIRRLRVSAALSEQRRKDLETLIDRQIRVTLPSLFVPRPNPRIQINRTAYDKRRDAADARLVTHVEAFRLAPDDEPRLYVRAFWASRGVAQTGLTLWIRDDGKRFHVERSNAAVSRLAHFGELQTFGSNVAEIPAYAGMLLNVIPSSDGWAYIIMGYRGYESMSVTVWKYSPDGPRDTGIAYSHGC
jgi:hypothetical protein